MTQNLFLITGDSKKKKIFLIAVISITLIAVCLILTQNPVFAADSTLKTLVTNVAQQVVYPVFTGIGAILGIYSVGQLVLAFKNDDPDGKTRASQTLVVAIVLLALPTMINNLKLWDYINTGSTGK